MVVLIGLVMSVAFVSCGSPTLQDYADELNNKEFPSDYGGGIYVKNCEIIDNYFVFRGEIKESQVPENAIVLEELYPNEFKEMSKYFEQTMLKNDGWKKLFKQCKVEKKGVKMIMKGDVSGKTVTLFDIPAERLQSMNF